MRETVSRKLESLDVPSAMIATALELLPASALGSLAYGSRSRGDAVADSDLDMIALVRTSQRTVNRDNVSLSFYTPRQLVAGAGSLFATHLRRDATVLWDPTGAMAATLDALGELDAPALLERARALAEVLGARERDLPKYLPGLLREARYLLRSSLYAKTFVDGPPSFSVRELSRRYEDPTLVDLLSSRPTSEATEEQLEECIARLNTLLGPLPRNRHGSLEALIVNEWNTDSDLVAMALLALGGSNSELDYVEVRKVLL